MRERLCCAPSFYIVLICELSYPFLLLCFYFVWSPYSQDTLYRVFSVLRRQFTTYRVTIAYLVKDSHTSGHIFHVYSYMVIFAGCIYEDYISFPQVFRTFDTFAECLEDSVFIMPELICVSDRSRIHTKYIVHVELNKVYTLPAILSIIILWFCFRAILVEEFLSVHIIELNEGQAVP